MRLREEAVHAILSSDWNIRSALSGSGSASAEAALANFRKESLFAHETGAPFQAKMLWSTMHALFENLIMSNWGKFGSDVVGYDPRVFDIRFLLYPLAFVSFEYFVMQFDKLSCFPPSLMLL
jgi:hypothetical protein